MVFLILVGTMSTFIMHFFLNCNFDITNRHLILYVCELPVISAAWLALANTNVSFFFKYKFSLGYSCKSPVKAVKIGETKLTVKNHKDCLLLLVPTVFIHMNLVISLRKKCCHYKQSNKLFVCIDIDIIFQMLLCCRCDRWFHQRCVSSLQYPLYAGDKWVNIVYETNTINRDLS